MTQADKANQFRALHQKGGPVVLYNIWDAGSAKAVAEAGANALATGSWSVAAAQGYDDGEALPLDFLARIVERITATVDLPLSVDFEGCYAADPAQVTENVCQIIQAGAIGINFEDCVVQGDGLYPVATQAERIKAARRAAELEGVPIFINARTDLFLRSDATVHAAHIDEALEREAAYAAAGADGFFVPALAQPELIRQVVEGTTLPINVMMLGDLTSIDQAAKLGVGRISFGPAPYRTAMVDLAERFKSATAT